MKPFSPFPISPFVGDYVPGFMLINLLIIFHYIPHRISFFLHFIYGIYPVSSHILSHHIISVIVFYCMRYSSISCGTAEFGIHTLPKANAIMVKSYNHPYNGCDHYIVLILFVKFYTNHSYIKKELITF